MDVELLRMNPLNSGFASAAARRDGGRASPAPGNTCRREDVAAGHGYSAAARCDRM
jgi:hypothetical protein